MSDIILIDRDTAEFISAFGEATVVVRPGILSASGKSSVSSKAVCLKGDEGKVTVEGCNYTTPVYIQTPGLGTLKIESLAGDQVAKKMKNSGKAVLLKGSQFNAVFEVSTPALAIPKGPAPPQPDSATKYRGKGSFTSTNRKWKSA